MAEGSGTVVGATGVHVTTDCVDGQTEWDGLQKETNMVQVYVGDRQTGEDGKIDGKIEEKRRS